MYLLTQKNSFTPNVVQSLVHGANVAVAHLQLEAALVTHDHPQAGRPFVISDPNAPVTYSTIYNTINTLSAYRFNMVVYSPLTMLLMTYITAFYTRFLRPFVNLDHIFPEIRDRFMKVTPTYFDFFRHVVINDAEAKKPVKEGGLGYTGVVTTLEGLVQEVLDWHEHQPVGYNGFRVKGMNKIR